MNKKTSSTIVFKNEDLLNKKLITSFLINHDVELIPTNNNYSEYQAVIKVSEQRTPTRPSKSPSSKNNFLINQINEMYSMLETAIPEKHNVPNKRFSAFELQRIDNIKTPELREEDSIIDNDLHPVNTKDLLIKAIRIQNSPKKKSPKRSPKKSPKRSPKKSAKLSPKKNISNQHDSENFSFVYSSDDREKDLESINKVRNSIRRSEAAESVKVKASSRKSSPTSPKSPNSNYKSPPSNYKSPKSPTAVKQFSVGDENYYSSTGSQGKYANPFSINPTKSSNQTEIDESSPAGKLKYYHSQESQAAERESRHNSIKLKEHDSQKNKQNDDADFGEVRVGKNFIQRKSTPLQESKVHSNQMNLESSPTKRASTKSYKEAETSKSSKRSDSNKMNSNQHYSGDQFYEEYANNYLSPQDLDDEDTYASIDFRKQLDKLRAINEALQNKNQIRQETDGEGEPYSSSSAENVPTGNFASGNKKVPRNSYSNDRRKSSPIKNEKIFKDISIVNIPVAEQNDNRDERMTKKNFPSVSGDKSSNYNSRMKSLGKKLDIPEQELKALDLVLKKLFPTQDPLTVIKMLATTSNKDIPLRIGDLPKDPKDLNYTSKSSNEESFLERVRIRDQEHRSPGSRLVETGKKYESPTNTKSPRSQSPPEDNLNRYYEVKSKLAQQKKEHNPNLEVKRELSQYDNLFLIKAQLGVKKTPLTPKPLRAISPNRSKSPTTANSVILSRSKSPGKSPKTPKGHAKSVNDELDDDEGWIDIKKLEKENRVAKQHISDLVFYGKKAVEARKKFMENEKNFKKKVDHAQNEKRSQSPIFRNNKGQLVNTSEVLAYKNNIQNITRLNEKKDIARKYSNFCQKSIENAISYYDQQECEIEKITSPTKPGRLEGMSSFDILRYHQLKLKKAQCLQVDYVRKVNKESHSYSVCGDEGEE